MRICAIPTWACMRELDFSQDDRGERLAEEFRRTHDVFAPVLDLPSIASRVFHADVAFMGMPEFVDAVTKRDTATGTTLVAIATSENPERQRFSLAHELGHLEFGHLHDHAEHETDSVEELQAHAFARHLLLPRRELGEFVGTAEVTLRTLSDIVEHFRVSGQVAAIQLGRFGFIDAATVREWSTVEASTLAVRYGWAEAHRARVEESLTPIPPARMVANATDAYIQNLLPLEAVAAVEGIPLETLRAQFMAAGIVPVATGRSVSLDDL